MENFCEIAYTIYQNVYQKIIDHQVVNEGRECVISKQIIYVDLLELDDFEDADKRFQSTLDYYLKLPGILHADEIWGGSENHYLQYQKALIGFAGTLTEERWKQRIKMNPYKKLWDEKSLKKKSGKKKLACFIDCSNMLYNGEDKIRKLSEMLDIFKQSIDRLGICLFYEKVCLNSIRMYDETVFTQFDTWLEEAKKYIEIRDAVELTKEDIEGYDAYYGDQGYLASQMIREKRPVMIQEIL